MQINIQNTSSPGASFTENTNNVILKTYDWILANKGQNMRFLDFRMALQRDKKINDNNNRNIYPLLKNCGLVNYEKGEELQVDHFFTKTGLAYVKALQARALVKEQDYTEDQIRKAQKKFDEIIAQIIFGALKTIMKKPGVNYIAPFQDLIKYIIEYKKVTKKEYALLLYYLQDYDIDEALIQMKPNVESFRAGDLDLKINVEVRNDLDLRERTNEAVRKEEGLSFLTSFGYFICLLQQAGLLFKDDNYYCLYKDKEQNLIELGGNNK